MPTKIRLSEPVARRTGSPKRSQLRSPRRRRVVGSLHAPPAHGASLAPPAVVPALEPTTGAPANGFRIVIRPTLGPVEGLDVTEAVVRAVAAELSRHHAGNDVLNWLEAEALIGALLGQRD